MKTRLTPTKITTLMFLTAILTAVCLIPEVNLITRRIDYGHAELLIASACWSGFTLIALMLLAALLMQVYCSDTFELGKVGVALWTVAAVFFMLPISAMMASFAKITSSPTQLVILWVFDFLKLAALLVTTVCFLLDLRDNYDDGDETAEAETPGNYNPNYDNLFDS